MARYRRRHERNVPRSWLSLFLRLGGWLAIVIGLALVVTTTFSAGALYLADRFDRQGALAYAVVSGKSVQTVPDTDGGSRDAFMVEFTYKVRGADGRPGRTVTKEVSGPYFNRVMTGEEQPIRYLLSDPEQIEEDIGQYRARGRALRWIGLFVGLAGLGALWLFGAQANRAIIVRRDGEKRYARVTGIRELKVTVAGARQGRLVWREEDGQVGESLMRSAQWLRQRYKAGDPVVVFRKGRHVFWEGDVGPPRRDIRRLPPTG